VGLFLLWGSALCTGGIGFPLSCVVEHVDGLILAKIWKPVNLSHKVRRACKGSYCLDDLKDEQGMMPGGSVNCLQHFPAWKEGFINKGGLFMIFHSVDSWTRALLSHQIVVACVV
jgi:hypothetical protein